MLHDDHIHLRAHEKPPKPHNLAAVLESARAKGIIPGIREHHPMPKRYQIGEFKDYEYGMFLEEVDLYIKMFADAGVPMGIEADFIAGEEEEIKEIIDDMQERARKLGVPVSGVHGSVHLLPGRVKDIDWPKEGIDYICWDLDQNVFLAHIKDRGPKQILHDYFGLMLDLVGLGIYDALSHIDVIRKFDIFNSSGESIYFGEHEKLYDKLARSVVEKVSGTRMAIEINTAGVFGMLGKPYFSQPLLNYAVELKVPISLGSDSHYPDRIGAGFDVALKMLETAGCEKIVTFKDRQLVEYSPF